MGEVNVVQVVATTGHDVASGDRHERGSMPQGHLTEALRRIHRIELLVYILRAQLSTFSWVVRVVRVARQTSDEELMSIPKSQTGSRNCRQT